MYEGKNPPYICNGTVYTRSGSSKVPIKSDRSSIDELLNKRSKLDDLLRKFCVSNFFPEHDSNPKCTIYLFNQYGKKEYTAFEEKINKIKEEFRLQSKYNRILDSIDSVIIMGTNTINANTYTSLEEYYIDDSIKINMPLFRLNNELGISSWINTVSEYNSDINLKDMVIIDGIITYMTLFRMLKSAFEHIMKSENDISDYKIVFEYKNLNKVVFYYKYNMTIQENREKFVNDIKEGKVFVCPLTEILTEPLSFKKEKTEDTPESYAYKLLYFMFIRLFGINNEIFSEVLEMSKGEYNQNSYSSDDY